MNEPLITICTPTFNRASLLSRCYDSLVRQKSKNFVWQIVDDGSTDDTKSYVERWIKEDKVIIEYYYKENGGKASALNFSLRRAKTILWFCLDSDDYLTDDAVYLIELEFPSVRNDLEVCGLFALRASSNGGPMQGVKIPGNLKYVSQQQIRYTHRIPPEYSHVFKTDVVRNFKYPEIPGEKYFPLSYVFDQIDQNYCYKVVHKCFMVCDYQESGMTKNKRKLIKDNPVGYTLYKKQLISLAPTGKERFKAAVNYVAGCILSKKTNIFEGVDYKWTVFLAIPFGFLDYLVRYKLRFDVNFE